MKTKQCFKCKKTLPLDSFYKHPKMADGRVNKCKECNKKDVQDNRSAKIDYYREYDKQRANNPSRVEARALYSKTDSGKKAHQQARVKWLESNVIKRSAQILVRNAIRDGKLQKSKLCTECGAQNSRIEGHHNDYAKPLDVTWLCSKCHRAWHKINEPLNG